MWKLWRNRAAAALLTLLCMVLGACSAYRFDESAQGGEFQAGPSAQMEQAGEFDLQINAQMQLDPGTGRLNALLGNPRSNTRDCRVTLVLDDTGEILYESKLLSPGDREAYVQIDADALEGKESCPVTAVFTILDEETGEEIGQVEAGVVVYTSLPEQDGKGHSRG